MARTASSDMRQELVADPPPHIATLLIARALAEVYRDALNQPVPERLAAILRQIETWENPYEDDPA